MPTYEYECKECEYKKEFGIRFEVGPDCDKCYKTMTRVWSAPAVKFNGPGFYSTGG